MLISTGVAVGLYFKVRIKSSIIIIPAHGPVDKASAFGSVDDCESSQTNNSRISTAFLLAVPHLKHSTEQAGKFTCCASYWEKHMKGFSPTFEW